MSVLKVLKRPGGAAGALRSNCTICLYLPLTQSLVERMALAYVIMHTVLQENHRFFGRGHACEDQSQPVSTSSVARNLEPVLNLVLRSDLQRSLYY